MKAAIITLIMVVGTYAQASFYQTNCSDARGEISMANGHVQNFLKVTKTDYSNRGSEGPKKEVIDLGRDTNIIQKLDEVSLVEEVTRGGCENGGGAIFSDETTVKKLVLTKADGTQFDERIFGISKDGKSIEAFMICHTHFNSMVFCPQPE